MPWITISCVVYMFIVFVIAGAGLNELPYTCPPDSEAKVVGQAILWPAYVIKFFVLATISGAKGLIK